MPARLPRLATAPSLRPWPRLQAQHAAAGHPATRAPCAPRRLQLSERRAGNQAYRGGDLHGAQQHYRRALAIVDFVAGASEWDQQEVSGRRRRRRWRAAPLRQPASRSGPQQALGRAGRPAGEAAARPAQPGAPCRPEGSSPRGAAGARRWKGTGWRRCSTWPPCTWRSASTAQRYRWGPGGRAQLGGLLLGACRWWWAACLGALAGLAGWRAEAWCLLCCGAQRKPEGEPAGRACLAADAYMKTASGCRAAASVRAACCRCAAGRWSWSPATARRWRAAARRTWAGTSCRCVRLLRLAGRRPPACSVRGAAAMRPS
jgi:hypothetical protein